MKKILLTSLALILLSVTGHSQTLQVDSLMISPDTVSANEPIFYTMVFSKDDSMDLQPAEVYIMARWNNGSDDTLKMVTMGLNGFGPFTITDTFLLSPAQVGGGTNSLVIWPMINQYTTIEPSPVTVEVSIPDGLKQDPKQDMISVFPNPASRVINISAPNRHSLLDYEITNLNGKSVTKGQTSTDEISLDGLNTGLYLLSIKLIDGSQFTRKITIMR